MRRHGAALAVAAVLVVVACWPMALAWAGACGDGNVDPGEACDPGPDVPGDCCSATCQFEPPSTPCEADGNLCTTDQCDGNGSCLFFSDVTCQAANLPCEGGEACNPSTGQCDPQPDAPPSTACEADGDLCTNDHCDGNGSCVLLSTVTCTALDQCHVAGTCNPATGVCSNPTKQDGQICDDGNVCTQGDHCVNGVCMGNNAGADSDGDGYCDVFESQQGCDPLDPREIPPQAVTYPGSGAGLGNALVTYGVPAASRILVASDPSCAPTGVCGPPPRGFVNGFCQKGRIADPCTADADCDLPAHTCRLVVNYAGVSDFVLDSAVLNRKDQPIASFTPAHPGCSRKVDVTLDTAQRTNRVRVKAEGTVNRVHKLDRDTFRYR